MKYTLETTPIKTDYSGIDYQKDLNQEQLEVTMAEGGPMLVIAGAGSGKTRTLTYRVSRLIESGVNPERILLVTFTNKAAKEMLSRVELLIRGSISRLWGGTFHHIGNLILRRHVHLLEYRNDYSIMDKEDQKDLLKICLDDLKVDTANNKFPQAGILADVLNLSINGEKPEREVIEGKYPHFKEIAGEVKDVLEYYRQKKRKINLLDYDDLLFLWKMLFQEHPGISDIYRERFLHVLVDEYQDTSRIQAEIIDLIAGLHRNVMVVGDDSQSIYSFRGADFDNMMTFPDRYRETKIFRLETNYRSTPQILNLTNASISRNQIHFPKTLKAVKKEGMTPSLLGFKNLYQQGAFIAGKILEMEVKIVRLD